MRKNSNLNTRNEQYSNNLFSEQQNYPQGAENLFLQNEELDLQHNSNNNQEIDPDYDQDMLGASPSSEKSSPFQSIQNNSQQFLECDGPISNNNNQESQRDNNANNKTKSIQNQQYKQQEQYQDQGDNKEQSELNSSEQNVFLSLEKLPTADFGDTKGPSPIQDIYRRPPLGQTNSIEQPIHQTRCCGVRSTGCTIF